MPLRAAIIAIALILPALCFAQAPVRLANLSDRADMARLPRFFSSDPRFDSFANEYFMRYLTVDREGIYSAGPMLGDTDHMWVVEWDSLMFPWIDRGAMGRERRLGSDTDTILTVLRDVAQDRYGYVFGGVLSTEPNEMMGGYKPMFGWPWPKYNRNTTVSKPTGWEFNDPNDPQRAEWGTRDMERAAGYPGFSLTARVTGPAAAITTPGFDVDVFQVPIVEADITYTGANAAQLVNGFRLYWSTSDHPGFSEERSVDAGFSVMAPRQFDADYARLRTAESARYPLFFPMLLHPEWGRSGRRITGMRIVPCGPEGQGATVSLNYVRATYDVRFHTTNAALVAGIGRFYQWSGDAGILASSLAKCRRSILFMNEHLGGRRHGLLCLDWYQGHDGLSGGLVGHGLIGSYWDLLPAGRFDLEGNIAYYVALRQMAGIERAAARLGIRQPMPTVVGPDNRTTLTYAETPASLDRLAARVRRSIEKRLWNPATGRFARNIDSNGMLQDYGFVHFNLLALAMGIGTADQRASVLSWLDGRKVIGDTSTGADIYRWQFAPRTSTRRNTGFYFWPWIDDWRREPDTPYRVWGDQVQDGGAVPFTSLFELMTRCASGNPAQMDRAWQRANEIADWFTDVKAAGGKGADFYRAYYDGHPERGRQQGGSGPPGGLGLDREFLSDAALGSTFPLYAFLGAEARQDGVLDLAPAVPTALHHLGVENVFYRGNHLRIEAGHGYVDLAGSRIPNGQALRMRIRFRNAPARAVVEVNGKPVPFRRAGADLVALLPLANVRVAMAVRP